MSGALLSPWMLLGLAALAAPVIAHLVHRREREGAPFPSLMFLRRVPSPVRRHLKIRDPWLLLLRCLLLLTLVLAFCDPRWFGVDEPVATAPTGRDVVVLLDRSYSMAYGERWSEAVALAESSLSALAPGDRAALVAFDDAVQVLSPLTGELGSLPALLASLRPGSRGTDFAAALAAGENLFLEDGSDQRELILVSDLQRVGLETREPRLGEGIQLSVVRAIGADDPNLTLLSAQVDTVRGELLAHVGSTGGDREVTSDLGLEIEGHDTASAVVSLGPGEEQIVTFPLVLADGTASHLRVHIADDALNADNELDLIAAPPPVVRALIVEPNGTGASSALFLEEAMSLLPMPRVAVERIEVSNLDSGTIARFDLVAFAGVPIPQGGVGEAVTRHVDGGGGLLLFGHASSSSGDGRTGTTPPSVESALVTELAEGHPVLQAFEGSSGFDLSSVSVLRHVALEIEADDDVIARLDTGAPVIVSRRGGAGRVVAVATSLDEDWSTLGVDPAFPALVMGLVRYLTDIGGQTHGARVGEPVDLRIYGRSLPRGGGITDTLDAGDALVVETPAGARDPVSATGIYTPQAPGVYEIHGSATAGRGLPLAVNADRRESDLALASMEDFQAALVRVNRMRRAPETADGEADERTGDGWSLAWYLLLLALAVAFVETLLCARMDRSRRHAVYAEGVAPGLADR